MFLYGASGHAKVIIDILKSQNQPIEGLIDDNLNITEILGIPVFHDSLNRSPIIVSIGDCHTRKSIVNKLKCSFGTAIHPSAIISDTVTIGEGSVIMQGAIIQTQVKIGVHCIVNTKSSIDHECKIGDFVHIAPGCTISGNVSIDDCTWIGVGTTIKQDVHIGKNCMIGAGSVIVSDIPDNVMAYGVPCKVQKTI